VGQRVASVGGRLARWRTRTVQCRSSWKRRAGRHGLPRQVAHRAPSRPRARVRIIISGPVIGPSFSRTWNHTSPMGKNVFLHKLDTALKTRCRRGLPRATRKQKAATSRVQQNAHRPCHALHGSWSHSDPPAANSGRRLAGSACTSTV
jgi:hypothetical protein